MDKVFLRESSTSGSLSRFKVVKKAPVKMMELVNPRAIGKRVDWKSAPRKLRKDCSKTFSLSRESGLIKLDKIKRRLGNKKTIRSLGYSF